MCRMNFTLTTNDMKMLKSERDLGDQQSFDHAWGILGRRYGFDPKTVEIAQGSRGKTFTAETT